MAAPSRKPAPTRKAVARKAVRAPGATASKVPAAQAAKPPRSTRSPAAKAAGQVAGKTVDRSTGKTARSESDPAGAKGLLRAGLKALGTVRDDVVKRQTSMIETLLGTASAKTDAAPGATSASAPAPVPRGFPSLDSFGIRKFEDVFDQRVATALQRLGMPSAQEVQELREQVRLLREQLDRVEPGRRKR